MSFSMQLASFTGFQIHGLLLSQELSCYLSSGPSVYLQHDLFDHVAIASAKGPYDCHVGLLQLSSKKTETSTAASRKSTTDAF